MKTVRLLGRFIHDNGKPAQGTLTALPAKLWQQHKGAPFAIRGAEVTLQGGCFDVELTTGQRYIVLTPFGRWEVDVPNAKQPVFLKDLIVEANAK